MVGRLHQIDFDTLHHYGTNKDSVEVPVTLRLGQTTVGFPAQLDTGATFCVFEQGYAEALGLALENGSALRFSTTVGSFDAYGHILTPETLGYSFDVMVILRRMSHLLVTCCVDAAGWIRCGLRSWSMKASCT